MTFTSAHLSVSLDGYAAGPDQSPADPIGRGGLDLHDWHRGETVDEVDRRWTEHLLRPRGAYVMGRNMFGPVRGAWSTWSTGHGEEWRGWWGEEPPYHAPVFVLTHHPRESLELTGTTFHFVTGGLEEGLRRAREAGDGDVDIAGGASVVRQALLAGELDELSLDVVPLLLGSGERPLDGVPAGRLEQVAAEPSATLTHLRYRVLR